MTAHFPDAQQDLAVIWLQTGFIGDVVLNTAAIALVQDRWPQTPQYVITTSVGAQVLASGPAPCIVFDKSGMSLQAMRHVRRELQQRLAGRRAVVLQAHRSARSTILSRYLGWPVVAYAETVGPAWRRVPRVAVLHEAQRIALLLEPLGMPRDAIVAARPTLEPLPLNGLQSWQRQVAEHRGAVVAVAPGSVWGTKRWLPEAFADLSKTLVDDGALVLLIGSTAEAALATEVANQVFGGDGVSSGGSLYHTNVLNLAGQTTLDDLRRLLPRCHLLVANDSSPVHYASALKVPTLALFGATVPGMGFAPLAPQSRTLGVDLDCRPCSDHGPQVCPLGHFRCMRDLSVGAAIGACRDLLKGRANTPD